MTTLLDLPREILIYIAEKLCPHCNSDILQSVSSLCPDSCASQSDQEWELIDSLASLTYACKLLAVIAQPVLFHSLGSRTEMHSPLLRSLLCRPDLANRARELHVSQVIHAGMMGQVSDADADLFESHIWKGYQYASSECLESPTSPRRAFLDLTRRELVPGRAMPDFLSWLTIALVPGIQRLTITTSGFEVPHLQPGSLPRLKQLIYKGNALSSGLSMVDIKTIFDAAPILDLLAGCMITNIAGVAHKNLRKLHLTHAGLSAECFNSICDNFPRLEAFSYQTGDGLECYHEEATLQESYEALHRRRDTLKHLSLDLRDTRHCGPNLWLLREMHLLETFEINYGSVLTDPNAPMKDVQEDAERLQQMFPPSIQRLRLRLRLGWYNPGRTLLKLAEMAPSKYPKLREVALGNTYGDRWSAWAKAFKSKGIECSRLDE